MKKRYLKPCIKSELFVTEQSLLTMSDMTLHSGTETYSNDVQYGRRGNSLWDDEDEEDW